MHGLIFALGSLGCIAATTYRLVPIAPDQHQLTAKAPPPRNPIESSSPILVTLPDNSQAYLQLQSPPQAKKDQAPGKKTILLHQTASQLPKQKQPDPNELVLRADEEQSTRILVPASSKQPQPVNEDKNLVVSPPVKFHISFNGVDKVCMLEVKEATLNDGHLSLVQALSCE